MGIRAMHDRNHVRLDKWLWAARIFKTRALATVAIHGGRVHVNGERVKASRDARLGDTVSVTRGQDRIELVVRGLSAHRRPAREAQGLYEETPESRALREERAELRRSRALENPAPEQRPDKKARRQIIRFTRRGEG